MTTDGRLQECDWPTQHVALHFDKKTTTFLPDDCALVLPLHQCGGIIEKRKEKKANASLNKSHTSF